jgi:uncharacterized membrane protein YhaH (DUF805 family)
VVVRGVWFLVVWRVGLLLVWEWDVIVGDFVPLGTATMVVWWVVIVGSEAAEEFGEDAFVAHGGVG